MMLVYMLCCHLYCTYCMLKCTIKIICVCYTLFLFICFDCALLLWVFHLLVLNCLPKFVFLLCVSAFVRGHGLLFSFFYAVYMFTL